MLLALRSPYPLLQHRPHLSIWVLCSMWRSVDKSTIRMPFSCSSFKDVQALCADEFSQPTARKLSVFRRVRLVNSLLRSWNASPPTKPDISPREEEEPRKTQDDLYRERPCQNSTKQNAPSLPIPGAEKRIVVYFTSLRVVRSTFEDCKNVRSILRGFRVSIDERDLSMDSRFHPELQQLIGQNSPKLPRVFIGGRYMGGAEEIRQLHEAGELKKLIEGLPPAEPSVCNMCGDYMFILCDDCNGSRKIYSEKSGFRTCTACNENGLLRCPFCSYAPL